MAGTGTCATSITGNNVTVTVGGVREREVRGEG